ncbi:ABC transporter permease [Streptomyces sp. CB02488]|uniref:ABC transporter permease n=1 Tax=Streptomyces sp. CB02488 TaxID=1703920 RepID=UPI0018FF0880|nr:ABC transporter permease [Streptomyces sp. CB02488]
MLGSVVLLGGWTLAAATGLLPRQTLAPPWTVPTTFWELAVHRDLWGHVAASLRLALVALVIGVALGVTLALFSGLSRLGEALIDGPIQVNRSIPWYVLVPVAISALGIDDTMKITMIVLCVYLPVYLNTYASLRGIDSRYVELAETLALNRWTFIRAVVLPGALPGFFLGLRLAATGSWLALVIIEQINAAQGMGFLMAQAQSFGQDEVVLVLVVLYTVFGVVSDFLLRALERKALSWQKSLGG